MSDDSARHDNYASDFVIVQLDARLAALPGDSLAHAANAKSLPGLLPVLKDFDSPPSQRLITSISVERLREMEAKAKDSPHPAGASLASFWRVDLRKQPHRIDQFVHRLRDLEEVVAAYPDTSASAPAVTPGNNPFYAQQGHLRAADVGIDAPFAWLQQGGDGAGIALVDLEMAWNFSHEDLAPKNPALLFGNQRSSTADQNHGTSCLGIMVGSDNMLGVVGIAPAASPVRTVSHFSNSDGNPGHVADAVAAAASALAAGDVLVLEVETGRGNVTGWPDNYPIEIKDAEYLAIALAVGQGIVVVGAAGNGYHDLDAYASPQGTALGKHVLKRGNPDFRDSGAILVGATTANAPHERLAFSNKGSRIDCYAWGENVVTAGNGDLAGSSPNNRYTGIFNGTSSATAIIGGACLAIQGVAQAATGQRLTPAAMRTLLADWTTGTKVFGSPFSDPSTAQLGVMPNLRKLLPAASLVPDIYLRDEIGDTGSVPSAGAVGSCPDIIVTGQSVADPDAAFGEGSGTENDDTLGGFAVVNADNYVYVRMRNRGTATSTGTTADVYWSEPATLVMPSNWTLIGRTAAVDVPRGDTLVVSPALVWPSATVPANGHYCCVAVLGSTQDPAPTLPAPGDWQSFLNFVTGENNVGWRNFNVVSSSATLHPQGFHIAGAPDDDRFFDLEVIQRLPEGARVSLNVPTVLAGPLARAGWQVKRERDDKAITVRLPPKPSLRLARVLLERGARHPAEVMVETGPRSRLDGHSVTIRQLYDGVEVGRITWRFVSDKRAAHRERAA